MDWCLLPPPTEAIIAEGQVIKGRFMGDPSHEYEHTVRKKMGEGGAAHEEEVTVSWDQLCELSLTRFE